MSTTPPRSRTPSGTAFLDRGAGEPLVLLHGVGMRAEAWTPQLDALSRGRRVVALDMPGHGESATLPAGAPLPAFVHWLGRTLDELDLSRVDLAGHSMGALIAGGAAATFGARIRRAALLNGVFRRSAAASAAVIARANEIAKGAIDFDGPLRRWFGGEAEHPEAYRLTRGWISGVDPAGYATAYAAFAHGDATYADRFAAIRGPALFLTGRQDPNSTPDMAEAMAAAVPNGRAAVIEGHRHMVNLTAPAEVNRLLAAWLETQEEPS